ncbi:hypothetical protein ES707_06698 [subsurface metagenome]
MKRLVILLQIFCVLVVLAGIIIEIIYGAHLGFILITLGSLSFAIAEKLNRYYDNKQFNTNHNRKE